MEAQGKGSILATKAVEAQGGVLATKAVETQGTGSILATEAVRTQGKDSVRPASSPNRVGAGRPSYGAAGLPVPSLTSATTSVRAGGGAGRLPSGLGSSSYPRRILGGELGGGNKDSNQRG